MLFLIFEAAWAWRNISGGYASASNIDRPLTAGSSAAHRAPRSLDARHPTNTHAHTAVSLATSHSNAQYHRKNAIDVSFRGVSHEPTDHERPAKAIGQSETKEELTSSITHRSFVRSFVISLIESWMEVKLDTTQRHHDDDDERPVVVRGVCGWWWCVVVVTTEGSNERTEASAIISVISFMGSFFPAFIRSLMTVPD